MSTHFFQMEEKASRLREAIEATENGTYQGPSLSMLMSFLDDAVRQHSKEMLLLGVDDPPGLYLT